MPTMGAISRAGNLASVAYLIGTNAHDLSPAQPAAMPMTTHVFSLAPHRTLRLAFGALALGALSACGTLGPGPEALRHGVDVPAAWAAPSDAGSEPAPAKLADWWTRFNDPVLSELVRQALAQGTSVRRAQAVLQQARAQREAAGAALGPSVDLSASAQRSRAAASGTTNSRSLSLDASWEADLFGARGSAAAASEAEARAAALSLGNAQASLAAEVALAYLDWRGQRLRLGIAQRNLAAQEATLQIVQWRVQAGLASSVELEQARAAAAQTRAQLPTLQANAAQALNSLAVLTGRAPGALAQVATTWPETEPPQPDAGLALAFPADVLRQRPDVGAAFQRAEAARQRVAQAEAARYPSLRLSGSLGLRSLASGTSAANSLIASLAAPLFDGGALRAQANAQAAAFEQARLDYESAVLVALREVEDALVSLAGDRERVERLQTAAQAAANAELLARQRYQGGLIDFATVLETQRSLLSAQDSLASARVALATDHVQLYKALGGGWLPDAAQP